MTTGEAVEECSLLLVVVEPGLEQVVGKYTALYEQTKASPDDCAAIARMLQAKHRTSEALSWVERGLAMQKESGGYSAVDLRELKRVLLTKSGPVWRSSSVGVVGVRG